MSTPEKVTGRGLAHRLTVVTAKHHEAHHARAETMAAQMEADRRAAENGQETKRGPELDSQSP